MEFLDPKKQKQHTIRLFIGYGLMAIALILTTVIFLEMAYGFGLKNGEVIQSGLIFMSSNPNPADIYVNGQKRAEQTNVRLLMPAGQYTFELKHDGYQTWKRAINIEGGAVARFDYPLLFPTKLAPTAVKKYDSQPGFVASSPDRRWLVVQADPAAYNVFDVFDTTKPDKAPVALTVPSSILKQTGTHNWKLAEWSNDNNHILMQHVTDEGGKTASEYILVDRENPAESVNLTSTLGVNPTKLELHNKRYDHYLVYTATDHRLMTATLAQPKLQPYVDHVFGYKTYGDNVVLYATDQGAQAGKAAIKLQDGSQTYTIRQVAASDNYLLELTSYSSSMYVVAGAPSENRTYIYKDPEATLGSDLTKTLVPVQVLKAANPSYVAFSDNARFVMAEGGQQFSVYDAETDKGYNYTLDRPLDAPQTHAMWMDAAHLMLVSQSRVTVFDFDKTNQATLSVTDPNDEPLFDREYKTLYTVAPQPGKSADGKDVTQFALMSTSLRTPQDK